MSKVTLEGCNKKTTKAGTRKETLNHVKVLEIEHNNGCFPRKICRFR